MAAQLKSRKKLEAFFREKDFNLNQLESEFSSLYQLFISNKKKWEDERNHQVVLYVSILCDLLISYYECDYVRANLEDLKKKKEEIDAFISTKVDKTDKEVSSLSPHNKSANVFSQLADSLGSSSQWKNNVALLNAYRNYWVFCYDLVNQSVTFLESSGFSDYLASLSSRLGQPYNTADFLKMLEKPQQVLRVFSVALYALRLMIELVMITKHIINAKLSEELSSEQVLIHEIEKRGFTMLSDAVWGTVNLLTNFNKQFHISDAAANNMVFVFLLFDSALLTANWLFDATKYNNRVQELEQRKSNLSPESTEFAIVQRQLDILNDEWEAQTGYYAINLAAASCLIVGFGATLVLPAGLGLSVLSMIGAALYASADEYKSYKQSAVALQRELENDGDNQVLIKQLTAESEEAYSNFLKGLAYNTAGPAFALTAAAFSLPLALLITVAYMGYQINNANQSVTNTTDTQPDTRDGIYRLLDKPAVEDGTNKPIKTSFGFFANNEPNDSSLSSLPDALSDSVKKP